MVTTVPAGDISVIARSPLKLCVMNVWSVTSQSTAPAPLTVSCDVTTAGPVGMTTGVEFGKGISSVPRRGGGCAAADAVGAAQNPASAAQSMAARGDRFGLR